MLRRHRPVILGIFALGASLLLAISCDDDKPVPTKPPDKRVVDVGIPDAPPDQYVPDKPKWWDQTAPGDTRAWYDQYVNPSPFGCQADSDCFGQKCCATPWGVKLCAPSCDLK